MSVARKIAAKNSDRLWLRSAFISAAAARRRTRPTDRPRSSADRARRRHASVLHLAVVGMVARLALLRGATDRRESPAFLPLLEELGLAVGELDHGIQQVHLHLRHGAGLKPRPSDRLATLALLLLLELRAGLRAQLRAGTLAILRLDSRREALGDRSHIGDIRAATTSRVAACHGEQNERHQPVRPKHSHAIQGSRARTCWRRPCRPCDRRPSSAGSCRPGCCCSCSPTPSRTSCRPGSKNPPSWRSQPPAPCSCPSCAGPRTACRSSRWNRDLWPCRSATRPQKWLSRSSTASDRIRARRAKPKSSDG